MTKFLGLLIISVVTAVILPPGQAWAAQANSSNYGVSEVQFGSGGVLRACSTNYCSKQSAGETAVGNTRSANYQAQAGGNTRRTPYLEVSGSGTPVDFGLLDAATTATASTTFSVKTYLASGYKVYINGDAPSNVTGGHLLTAMNTAGPAQTGIEQFGINLRANTSPVVGAEPVQTPGSEFSFGVPAPNYNTPNSFRYVNGDMIASSPSSSSYTNYTLSMIANISPNTASGLYKGRLTINVVPTF